MAKKHYIEIARVLKEEYEGTDREHARDAIYRVACALCGLFSQDNPRFDKYKFLVACGLEN